MNILRTVIIFCFTGLYNSNLVLGQDQAGPYDFSPPTGALVYEDQEQSTLTYKPITMDKLNPLGNNIDGLIVFFNIHLEETEKMKPILSFSTNGMNGANIIEFYYDGKTATVKRFVEINGIRKSYDYLLFDPLFDFQGGKDYVFRAYFTSNFLYLVTKDSRKSGFYMSPTYFGLDVPGSNEHNMKQFLERSAQATLKVGDSSRTLLPYISDIKIYAFNYPDWAKMMQLNFSAPNPPASN